jgi:hypothetical protein
VPARERNVEDIGQQLNDRGQAALRRLGVRGGQIAGPHPVTDELLARNLALETKQALDRGGQTALDWYSKKFEDAMALAAEVHPEIGSDPHAATAYRAALAITSQGETVPSNVRLANVAYDTYKRTGRFPTNLTAKQAPAMNNGFAKMNGIIDAIGPEGATHLLSDMRPAREWQRLGFKISGENADTMLHGSAVLGPKIGGGFYQNLSGNFDPTTFDLWWMRRWNRTTGNLVGLEDLTNQRARLEAELGKARDLAAAGTPNPNLTPRMQAIANQPLPKTMPALIRRAEEIEAEHERHYGSKLTRPLYETGEFEKSDLAKAAIALREGVSGINEAPTGGAQRNWMRAVTARAREILAAHGIHMSNADIQATVWYPEKDLYAKLGGKPSEGLNVDYASAHRNLARERGVPDDRIQSALERSDRGRVRDDVAGGDQGDVGGSQGRGQISGQDDAARTDAGRPAAAPPPNPYVGRSAERNQGDLESDVLALHSAGPASNSALPFHEMNPAKGGSEAFHSAIAAAKAANPHGAAVALYSPDEYRDMRTFLTQDRSAGFALKGDDIVSVFKHPNSPHGKIANSSILPLATAQGGRRLDAFDTNLPSIYADSDFRAVARLPWNDAYAPEGWNYDRMKKYNNGRPDVVFMTHEPHGTPRYEPGDGKQVQSYDKGNAAQEKALKAVDMRAKASTFAGRWRDLSTEEQRQIADEVLQAKEESK